MPMPIVRTEVIKKLNYALADLNRGIDYLEQGLVVLAWRSVRSAMEQIKGLKVDIEMGRFDC